MAESESIEMYLKSILELSHNGDPVSIAHIAERLGVSTVSANEMVNRLAEREMIERTPYKGVTLTLLGQQRAMNVLRKHRLWEVFLVNHLNIPWETSHDLACQLEHATTTEVTDRLAEFLGNPTECPHGNAIPDESGFVSQQQTVQLNELELGVPAVISHIHREETPLLDYLAERNLFPGMEIVITEIAPYNGPLTIKMNAQEIMLGREIAARILVKPA